MAAQCILTLNAGSSSLKYALFERPALRRLHSGKVERMDARGPSAAAAALDPLLTKLDPFGGMSAVAAIGHRIVHGGPRLQQTTWVTDDVVAELRRLSDLDPDHLPAEVAILEEAARRLPGKPQIACFDTAFHRALPRVAQLFALPRRYDRAGIRRYGFHGLSYQFLVEELARLAGPAARGRLVLAHLGSGSSLAAVHQGRCVDTTMAFTPNSGVPMGTRSGDLDPGVLVHLLRRERLAADALDALLSHDSGLLGVSETSADMRDLLGRERDDPRAADAVALFCYQVRKAIGALAAALGGLDGVVFAGGIGENAPVVRARIAEGLEHLGIHLDRERNEAGAGRISVDSSTCAVWVIRTDEEFVIARETAQLLGM